MTGNLTDRVYDFEAERGRFLEAVASSEMSPALVALYGHLDVLRQREFEAAVRDKRSYRLHGLCSIVGYIEQQHARYFPYAAGDDVFSEGSLSVMDIQAPEKIFAAMQEDGAIIISPSGMLLQSGQLIYVPNSLHGAPEHAQETYARLRKTQRAGTRHASAIALSAAEPDLYVFTLRSESPGINVFQNGYLIHSTDVSAVQPRSPPGTSEETVSP